jgi:hypothetical protein
VPYTDAVYISLLAITFSSHAYCFPVLPSNHRAILCTPRLVVIIMLVITFTSDKCSGLEGNTTTGRECEALSAITSTIHRASLHDLSIYIHTSSFPFSGNIKLKKRRQSSDKLNDTSLHHTRQETVLY